MRHRFVFLITVLLNMIWPSSAWASAPQPPDCREETPAYLATIADPANLLEYFHDWELQSVRACQGGSTEVFLQYVLPAAYSSLGLTYNVTVRFTLQDNAIAYGDQLRPLYSDYRARIVAFENDPGVKRFVQITGFTGVDNADANAFQINPHGRDSLTFSSAANAVTHFTFVNPHLIEDMAFFVPVVPGIPQIAEFRRHYSIGYTRFDDDHLYIAKDAECPDCNDRIVFDLDPLQVRVHSYSLSNNFTWETLPEIAQAHRFVEEHLLKEELPNCEIGHGDLHTYTMASYRYGSTDRSVTVALKCDGGIHWKDAGLILHPDGTYERLRVEFDYHATPTPRSPGSNLGCFLAPIALVAVSTCVWPARRRRTHDK